MRVFGRFRFGGFRNVATKVPKPVPKDPPIEQISSIGDQFGVSLGGYSQGTSHSYVSVLLGLGLAGASAWLLSQPKQYSLHDVKKNDWLVIPDGRSGTIVDPTEFISLHPGGEDTIRSALGGSVEPFWKDLSFHHKFRDDIISGEFEGVKVVGKLRPEDFLNLTNHSTQESGSDAILTEQVFTENPRNSQPIFPEGVRDDNSYIRSHGPPAKINPNHQVSFLNKGCRIKFSITTTNTRESRIAN